MGGMPSQIIRIPDGPDGVTATLTIMRDMVRAFKTNILIRSTALQIVQGCPQKGFTCEVNALFEFVRDSISYRMDVNGVETLQTPDITLQNLQSGDCDDKVTLLCALLESIGHPTKMIAIGLEPGIYCHVYAATRVGNAWVPMDPTEPVELGWQPDPSRVVEQKTIWN